jgi:IS5 family transposase
MLQRPDEAGMESGPEKVPNQNLDINSIHSSTKNTSSSEDSIHQLHPLHDNQVDLSQKGETVYRNKGYFGTIPFASIDKTMKRSVRGKPISTKDKRRNRAISRTRSLVERPFAVIKRVFHAGHVMVTTHLRIHAKNLFACFSYNLFNLVTVQKNHTV